MEMQAEASSSRAVSVKIRFPVKKDYRGARAIQARL